LLEARVCIPRVDPTQAWPGVERFLIRYAVPKKLA
jgi:hypothetical protein